MGCEESFITMKLIWYGYLIFNLGFCAYKTPIEIGLRSRSSWREIFYQNLYLYFFLF